MFRENLNKKLDKRNEHVLKHAILEKNQKIKDIGERCGQIISLQRTLRQAS